jgi:hypothetical protein
MIRSARAVLAPTLLALASLVLLPAAVPAQTGPAQTGPAQTGPESHASLIQRTPPLTLAAAPVPLTAPLAIGGAGWGAFKRLCVTRHLIQPDGKEVLETEPSCFTATAVRHDGSTWHLDLLSDPLRGGPRVAFATTRDAEGVVGPVAITVPADQPAPPAAMMTRLQTVFRIMIEAHATRRRTIEPGMRFVLPLQLSAADPDTTAEDDGFACMPDGTATLRGRAVLVATCRTMARTDLGDEAVARIDMAGRFAIDTETGMILQHRYASFLFIEQDPKKKMPNLRWRGVSRQDLE